MVTLIYIISIFLTFLSTCVVNGEETVLAPQILHSQPLNHSHSLTRNGIKCNRSGMVECDGGVRCYNRLTEECDKVPHCMDGMDEMECEVVCREEEFKCGGGRDSGVGGNRVKRKGDEAREVYEDNEVSCLHMMYVCDGHENCPSGSDENNCSTCPPHHLDCLHNGATCIHNSKICNQVIDCPNGIDELCDVSIDTNQSELLIRGAIHSDTPCQHHPCHHACHDDPYNTQAYHCSCKPPFLLHTDQHSCVLHDPEPRLWFVTNNRDPSTSLPSQSTFSPNLTSLPLGNPPQSPPNTLVSLIEVAMYSLKTMNTWHFPKPRAAPIAGLSYDLENSLIFWIQGSSIYMHSRQNSNNTQLINLPIHYPHHTPTHLAYDWINMNLYFTTLSTIEPTSKDLSIGVISVGKAVHEGVLRVGVVVQGGFRVVSLVIDPRNSYGSLYWIQQNTSKTGLYKSNVDGSQISMITSLRSSSNQQSLVLDLSSNALYWMDTQGLHKYHLLTHASTTTFFQTPCTLLCAFNGRVFWNNLPDVSTLVYKEHGGGVERHPFNNSLQLITISHPILQPRESHRACKYKGEENSCDHICLPFSVSSLHPQTSHPSFIDSSPHFSQSIKCLCHQPPPNLKYFFRLDSNSTCVLVGQDTKEGGDGREGDQETKDQETNDQETKDQETKDQETKDRETKDIMARYTRYKSGNEASAENTDMDSLMGYAAFSDKIPLHSMSAHWKLILSFISIITAVSAVFLGVHLIKMWKQRVQVVPLYLSSSWPYEAPSKYGLL